MKCIKWKIQHFGKSQTELYITLSEDGVDIKARNTIRTCENFRENHNSTCGVRFTLTEQLNNTEKCRD